MSHELIVSAGSAPELAGGDWGTLVERIRDESKRLRPIDADRIKRAIVSAIEYYEDTRFWFNEGYMSFPLVTGRNEYQRESQLGSLDGFPLDLLEIDDLLILWNGRRYPLDKISWGRIRVWDTNTTTGVVPNEWAWHHDRIYLYPEPADGITAFGDEPETGDMHLEGPYLKRLTGPTASWTGAEWVFQDQFGNTITDDYTDPWLQRAEPLIRGRAEWELYNMVLFDDEGAQRARNYELEALRRLNSATAKLIMPDSVWSHAEMW